MHVLLFLKTPSSRGCEYMPREFTQFSWKHAHYRICSTRTGLIIEEIKHQRALLEAHILKCPSFRTAFGPIQPISRPPRIALKMHRASEKMEVGPMAAVAGAIAQYGAQAALSAGADEAIVENGGDIFLSSKTDVIVSLFSGATPLSHILALRIGPEMMPMAICSSSAAMGHSFSFGNADLVTVMSKDAALADAAATRLCNLVRNKSDIQPVLEQGHSVEGVDGILIAIDQKVGLIGEIPELIRQNDPGADIKISRSI